MKAIYDKRLALLEATGRPPQVMRILERIIDPDGSLHSLHAEDSTGATGRSFERQPGESDEAFEARACAVMGWPNALPIED